MELLIGRQHVVGDGPMGIGPLIIRKEGTVSNKISSEIKGSRSAGSYAPEWEKKSLDIAPPSDQDLPKNPVAEAIMGGDSPSNQRPEQSQQNSPDQHSSDQSPAES